MSSWKCRLTSFATFQIFLSHLSLFLVALFSPILTNLFTIPCNPISSRKSGSIERMYQWSELTDLGFLKTISMMAWSLKGCPMRRSQRSHEDLCDEHGLKVWRTSLVSIEEQNWRIVIKASFVICHSIPSSVIQYCHLSPNTVTRHPILSSGTRNVLLSSNIAPILIKNPISDTHNKMTVSGTRYRLLHDGW